jgi:hypothetical protein
VEVRRSETLGKAGFIAEEGFVPSAEVAEAIREAILFPIYGKRTILSERPFQATLKGATWIITGSAPRDHPPHGAGCAGGSAEGRISKKTGQFFYMTDYK